MKQFDLQGNEYDIQIKDMIDPIENWQYVSGTRGMGKSYCQSLLDEKDKEIERLNKQIEEYQKALDETTSEKIDLENIIKETRECIKENMKIVSKEQAKDTRLPVGTFMWNVDKLLEILDKGGE